MNESLLNIFNFLDHNYVHKKYRTTKEILNEQIGIDYKEAINNGIPDYVNSIIQDNNYSYTYKIDGSIGEGYLAHVPHITVKNTDVTSSAKEGFYIAFLFAHDGQALYLTLNQGVTMLKEIAPRYNISPNAYAKELANKFRAKLEDSGTDTSKYDYEIDLKSRLPLPRSYENANIISKKYTSETINLIDYDFQKLMEIYEYSVKKDIFRTVNYIQLEDKQELLIKEDRPEFRVGKRQKITTFNDSVVDISNLSEILLNKGNIAESSVLDTLKRIFGDSNVTDVSSKSYGFDIKIIGNKEIGLEVKNISSKTDTCFYLTENEIDKLLRFKSRLVLVDNNQVYISKHLDDADDLKSILIQYKNTYSLNPDQWLDSSFSIEAKAIRVCYHHHSFYKNFISLNEIERNNNLTKEFLSEFLNITK